MILNLVVTIRRRPYRVLAQELFCDRHWHFLKDTEGFKADDKYEIKVSQIESDSNTCVECRMTEKER